MHDKSMATRNWTYFNSLDDIETVELVHIGDSHTGTIFPAGIAEKPSEAKPMVGERRGDKRKGLVPQVDPVGTDKSN